MIMMTRTALLSAMLALSFVPALAQGRGGRPPAEAAAQAEPAAAAREEHFGPAEEKLSTTPHTVRLDEREIKYTATVGTIPIRLDSGDIAARMFFVAYAKDGEDVKTRPVSFLYNSGPGAATLSLHMGSFAPRHVPMAD